MIISRTYHKVAAILALVMLTSAGLAYAHCSMKMDMTTSQKTTQVVATSSLAAHACCIVDIHVLNTIHSRNNTCNCLVENTKIPVIKSSPTQHVEIVLFPIKVNPVTENLAADTQFHEPALIHSYSSVPLFIRNLSLLD